MMPKSRDKAKQITNIGFNVISYATSIFDSKMDATHSKSRIFYSNHQTTSKAVQLLGYHLPFNKDAN